VAAALERHSPTPILSVIANRSGEMYLEMPKNPPRHPETGMDSHPRLRSLLVDVIMALHEVSNTQYYSQTHDDGLTE
jgi:hypothetical protein